MKALKSALCLLIYSLTLTACKHVEEGRFLANARINDHPVKLAYDTGSEGTLIFSKTVRRAGLKEAQHPSGTPPPGKVMLGQTEFSQFKLEGESYSLKLATLHLPWWWGFDVGGVIGWPDMTDDVIEIDAASGTMRGLDKLPEETRKWLRFTLYPHTGVLALEVPREDGKIGVVEIDTGNSAGVSLAPERWDKWKAAHPGARRGWTFSLMPGTGATLGRRYTAEELNLGPLMLHNVPVRKANQTEVGIAGTMGVFEGSIGFRALERINLIVDRKNQVAYVQCKPAFIGTNEISAKVVTNQTLTPTNIHLRLSLRNHEYFDHAMAAFDGLKFEEAIGYCKQLLELEPTNLLMWACNGESRYHLGAAQRNKVNLDEAIAEMTRVLKANPGISRAYMVRGNALYLERKWEEAARDFRTFCEMDSREASYAHFVLWMMRAQSTEKKAADEELGAFVGRDKKTTSGVWEENIGNFLLGRLDEAHFLHAANVQDVKHPNGIKCEAWFYAGFKRRLAGDLGVARDYFEKSVATGMKEYDEYGFALEELVALKHP